MALVMLLGLFYMQVVLLIHSLIMHRKNKGQQKDEVNAAPASESSPVRAELALQMQAVLSVSS